MLGVRQSGMQAFRFARLPEDLELLERARRWAHEILDADPELRARTRPVRGRDRRAPSASDATSDRRLGLRESHGVDEVHHLQGVAHMPLAGVRRPIVPQ